MNYYLGLDPGVSGGIAVLIDTPAWAARTCKLGVMTDRDVLDFLSGLDIANATSFAILERVSASPQMGVVSAFTFGRGYGKLEMALTSIGIPFDYVTPQKWQQAMGCRSHGDKNVTKRRAQQLFPRLTVTHAIADALLIAEFCRRSRTGTHVEKVKETGTRQKGVEDAKVRQRAEARPESDQQAQRQGHDTRQGQASGREAPAGNGSRRDPRPARGSRLEDPRGAI